MKKAILALCFILCTGIANAQSKQEAIFFYSQHCKICLRLEQEYLPAIKDKYKDTLTWKSLETSSNPDNLATLVAASQRFHKSSGYVPAIIVGNTFLVGDTEIKQFLIPAIESALFHKPKPFALLRADLMDFFSQISLFTVIGAGLIDGINPCAFAVIVFFVSFLGVYGYRKREILWVGSAYCLSVFITYLLMGLGLFQFLYQLSSINKIIHYFYFFVGNFCFLLSLLALYDYYKFTKTGQTDEMVLQLPKFFKKRINTIIGTGLREKKGRSVISLAIASLTIGFLVSILEAVCTGQVYLPTIVYILKTSDVKLKAFFYLILYNLMFIFPLIIIFALSLAGVSSAKFNGFLKRHVGLIKVFMVFLFFILGILILHYA